MQSLINPEFLLSTPTAQTLYHTYAETAPILDYHCHIDPREIWEDKAYPNLAQLWLGVGGSHFGDHYKWRLMRSCGVDEQYITGSAPDEERFVKWAECLELAVGNPLYHWSHLELKRYFGVDECLTGENAREIYRFCSQKLREPTMSVRGLIRSSGVRLICTTDDPADTLEWHQKLAADSSFAVQVLPAMRPDRAKNLGDADFLPYLMHLAAAAGMRIDSFAGLQEALRRRMDVFAAAGCRLSDHALETVPYAPADGDQIEAIFARRLAGQLPDKAEAAQYETALLLFLGREYQRRGWTMQLHFGCRRNNNRRRFTAMGPDIGCDCIGDPSSAANLAEYLNALDLTEQLPRTILYSLNPNDNAAIASIIGCFQDSSAAGKLQLGSAWWFNDHLCGMTEQLTTLANLGCLSGFVGMLTDSRSFLSYTRHEYFRRILCRLLGQWVEDGLYPPDEAALKRIVKGICYNNAVGYFGFPLEQY